SWASGPPAMLARYETRSVEESSSSLVAPSGSTRSSRKPPGGLSIETATANASPTQAAVMYARPALGSPTIVVGGVQESPFVATIDAITPYPFPQSTSG